MNRFKKFMSLEIGIEFKACLYFCVLLSFYFVFLMLQGSFYANIIKMIEMVFTAYIICYLQVYLFQNFDEAEKLGKREIAYILICSILYTVLSYCMEWFDQNDVATICFFFYSIFWYVCIWLIYRIKREVDTVILNQDLEQFKQRKNATEKRQ